MRVATVPNTASTTGKSSAPTSKPLSDESLARDHSAGPEVVDDLALDPEDLMVGAAFDILSFTGDRALVQDGVLLSDQCHVVHHLNETGQVHPLTDTVRSPLVKAVVDQVYAVLDMADSKDVYRLIDAEHAVKMKNGHLTGEVRDLIVYSSADKELNSELVLSVVAQALAKQGAKVYTDKDWTRFAVVRNDDSSLSGETLILRVQPKGPADNLQFFGSIEATNSRRVATSTPSDIGTRVEKFEGMIILKATQMEDRDTPLKLLTLQGENPWTKPKSGLEKLKDRVIGLASRK